MDVAPRLERPPFKATVEANRVVPLDRLHVQLTENCLQLRHLGGFDTFLLGLGSEPVGDQRRPKLVRKHMPEAWKDVLLKA